MIIILNKTATQEDQRQLINKLKFMGFVAVPHQIDEQFAIAIVNGIDKLTKVELFKKLPLVEKITASKQLKLVSKEFKRQTIINLKGQTIGGDKLAIMAGPCAIESEQNIFETAELVAKAGATILRGGAFKPRTSPYDFQGLGEDGLRYMNQAAEKYNLLSISEVMDIGQIDLVAKYVDIIQIGTRNMQNFSLLKAVGKTKKAVLLKRGFSATYNDLLMAAEYILNEGNFAVILCERGIRTFETYTRSTLDLTAVPVLHELSHLPIIVDPSHGTGIRSMVMPMARAAIAAGADGIMVEVHPNPDAALSDAKQTINVETFAELVKSIQLIRKSII